MNELERALLRRAAERQLRKRGRSISEAKREVALMDTAELERTAQPTFFERVKARLSA